MSIESERSRLIFQKTERALRKLSSGQEAESVHGFRTASRRLQTLLEQIIPVRNRSQKKLLKMLGRTRKCAGKVRDLDVQLSALRSLKVPQEPRRKTQLTHGLIELRAKHEKKLRKMLTKGMIREIQKRLKRASREIKSGADLDPLTVARTMLAQVVRPAGPVTEEVLHQYRIVVKRARYAAEFASKSTAAVQMIAQLKRLQDALGNWHDWLTLTQTASKRIGDAHQSSLVAALHHVTGSKFRQAVAALSNSPMLQTPSKSVSMVLEQSRKPGTTSPMPVAKTETAA
jgi:CHAD domain-containing protein